MPEQHSSVAGGSSAARLINCPGSAALLARLPKIVDRDSVYSIEGTALHTVMELLITGKLTMVKLRNGAVNINTRSGPVTITPELTHDAIEPAWAYWQDFLKKVDTWQLETVVQFPGIDGAFGTSDVLGRDDRENITYVTDWKFGAGEGVKASYPDPDDDTYEIVNEQLMFYAAGAWHTQPEFFPPDCKVVLTIVQPRARGQDPITSVEVSLEDLRFFAKELQVAVMLATKADAPTKKGRWCRFQACQTVCPHHTGPLFSLELLSNEKPSVLTETVPGYQVTLLDILNAAPAVEALIREARSQAHLILGNGGEVPGWKLVAKRGTRQWAVSDTDIAKTLKLKKADLYDTILKSPAQVEKLLPKKTKLPEGLATVVSSGTTIAPAADKRPAVSGDPNELQKLLLEVLEGEE
jgi:Protein of unknown function (DUF2800)